MSFKYTCSVLSVREKDLSLPRLNTEVLSETSERYSLRFLIAPQDSSLRTTRKGNIEARASSWGQKFTDPLLALKTNSLKQIDSWATGAIRIEFGYLYIRLILTGFTKIWFCFFKDVFHTLGKQLKALLMHA